MASGNKPQDHILKKKSQSISEPQPRIKYKKRGLRKYGSSSPLTIEKVVRAVQETIKGEAVQAYVLVEILKSLGWNAKMMQGKHNLGIYPYCGRYLFAPPPAHKEAIEMDKQIYSGRARMYQAQISEVKKRLNIASSSIVGMSLESFKNVFNLEPWNVRNLKYHFESLIDALIKEDYADDLLELLGKIEEHLYKPYSREEAASYIDQLEKRIELMDLKRLSTEESAEFIRILNSLRNKFFNISLFPGREQIKKTQEDIKNICLENTLPKIFKSNIFRINDDIEFRMKSENIDSVRKSLREVNEMFNNYSSSAVSEKDVSLIRLYMIRSAVKKGLSSLYNMNNNPNKKDVFNWLEPMREKSPETIGDLLFIFDFGLWNLKSPKRIQEIVEGLLQNLVIQIEGGEE